MPTPAQQTLDEIIGRMRAHAKRIDDAATSVDGRALEDLRYYFADTDPREIATSLRSDAEELEFLRDQLMHPDSM